MASYRISTIGRNLDLQYLTNRLIAIIVFFTFLSVSIYNLTHKNASYTSLLAGLRSGLLIFMIWAISRELDPDNDWSAFAAVFLALLVIPILEKPPVIVFLWLLLVLRMITHSTGMPAGIIDSFVIVLLGLLMTYYMSWIYGAITAAGLIIDSQLEDPSRYHLPSGIFMAIFSAFIYAETGGLSFRYTIEELYPAIIGTILFIPFIAYTKKLTSTGDRTGKNLDPLRIKAARIIAILTFVGIVLVSGKMNVSIIYFMFCIFAGPSIYLIANNVAKIIKD